MLNVYISQPMRGLHDHIIQLTRNEAMMKVKDMFPNEQLVIIDSFFKDAPTDAMPVWYLGDSIKLMSKADIVVFCKGWETARGCCIEHKVAEDYGYKIIEL